MKIVLSFIISYTSSLNLSTRLILYSKSLCITSSIPLSYSFSLITQPIFLLINLIYDSYPASSFLFNNTFMSLVFLSKITLASSFFIPCSYNLYSPSFFILYSLPLSLPINIASSDSYPPFPFSRSLFSATFNISR